VLFGCKGIHCSPHSSRHFRHLFSNPLSRSATQTSVSALSKLDEVTKQLITFGSCVLMFYKTTHHSSKNILSSNDRSSPKVRLDNVFFFYKYTRIQIIENRLHMLLSKRNILFRRDACYIKNNR
jgi:hypothetical protein